MLVRFPVDWGPPEAAFTPDQAPDALQPVTLVVDQVIADELPLVTEVGLAEMFNVGGEEVFCDTVVLWVILPPDPVQVIV